jgi:hypothetical protein
MGILKFGAHENTHFRERERERYEPVTYCVTGIFKLP